MFVPGKELVHTHLSPRFVGHDAADLLRRSNLERRARRMHAAHGYGQQVVAALRQPQPQRVRAVEVVRDGARRQSECHARHVTQRVRERLYGPRGAAHVARQRVPEPVVRHQAHLRGKMKAIIRVIERGRCWYLFT